MQSRRAGRRALGLCAVAVLLAAGPLRAAHHEPEPLEWNAKRVANLARSLVIAVKNIKVGMRVDAKLTHPHQVVLQDLGILQHRVVAFEGFVRSGVGRDETEPMFRRIMDVVEQTRQDVGLIPSVKKHERDIAKAEKTLAELARYY